MQLLIINPNTSTRVTEAIKTVAERSASSQTHLKIVQAATGPETIRCRHEELLSVPATLDCVRAESSGCEGVLFACFGDHPAIYATRELLTQPVVGIAEASMHTACFLGHRFSVLTTNVGWIPLLWDAAERYGLGRRCASIRALDLSGGELLQLPPEAIADKLTTLGQQALEQDGAEVLCLGGAALAGFDDALQHALQVPVLDGVACGLKMLEGLVGAGLKTSKYRSYRHP